MRSSRPDLDPRAVEVAVDGDTLTVDLVDGRRIMVPLAWFPRLLHATAAQRKNCRLIGDGQGVHWPGLDEDLSVRGLLMADAPRTSVGPSNKARPRGKHPKWAATNVRSLRKVAHHGPKRATGGKPKRKDPSVRRKSRTEGLSVKQSRKSAYDRRKDTRSK